MKLDPENIYRKIESLLEILPIQNFAVRFVGFFSSGKLSKSTKRDGILFDDMKLIPLHGKYAMGRLVKVDDWWFEELSKFKWAAHSDGYAVRKIYVPIRRSKTIYMHRLIAKTPIGLLTDHIDMDVANNQECNLRNCTKSQNLCNRGKQKNNKSGFKGVSWHRGAKKFLAQIHHSGINFYLGLFETAEEAWSAYKAAAELHHQDFSRSDNLSI